MLDDLRSNIEKGLRKNAISSKVLLSRVRLLEEKSKETGAYKDPLYFPFYYFLGKFISPKNMIDIGVGLGIASSCFLKSCKSVESFVGFQEKADVFYNLNLAKKNIQDSYRKKMDFYCGSIVDEPFEAIKKIQWDLVLINEEQSYDKHLAYLEYIWNSVALGGLIVIDKVCTHLPCNKSFNDFCKIKNRKGVVLKTRYGHGILQK